MHRNTLRILPALCSLALPAAAGDSQARMGVYAAVLPRTEVQIETPAALVLTTADVQRGSLLLPEPVRVKAYSNTRHGLELELQAPPGLFATLRVQGPGVDARLPGEGGSFVWRWEAKPGFQVPATVELRLSAELLSSTPTGRFDWPLHLAGRALAQ
jgi:hypothetical protein